MVFYHSSNWLESKHILISRRPASTQHGFEEPHSILRNESAHISSVMEASFNRENSCVPPFGAEKFVNSRRRPDVLQQPLFEEQG